MAPVKSFILKGPVPFQWLRLPFVLRRWFLVLLIDLKMLGPFLMGVCVWTLFDIKDLT